MSNSGPEHHRVTSWCAGGGQRWHGGRGKCKESVEPPGKHHEISCEKAGTAAVSVAVDRLGPNIDHIDRSIIEQLQRDGRAPYTRLGAAVGLSEAAVRQRVQRLTDAGLMQVVAVTNPLSHGKRRMAMIGVRTEGPIDDIAKTLQAMHDIDYLVVTAGSFDLMCEVVVENDLTLLELTNRIRAVPGVMNTETFIYLDLVKQTFTWGAH
jgi:Lrp/AsnC family transcriptional regulator for asnA, asnC and gidA